ncbi:MAG: hypothetical protein N2114_05020 [Candidatus Goldbacteria bacterium]|nr:hypothetical protein [Candidatus Goldiibacteriota bacterium]
MLDIIDKKLNEYLIQFYKEYNNQNPVIYSDAMRESFLEHWRNWYKEHIDRFSDFGAKEDREKLFFLFRKYVRLNYRLYVIYQEIKESQMKVKKYPVKNEKKFVECVKTAIKRFKRRMFLSKDKRDEIITQKIDELKDYINNFIKEKRGEKI